MPSVPEASAFLVKQTRDPKGDMLADFAPSDTNLQVTCGFWKSYLKLRPDQWKEDGGYDGGKYVDILDINGGGVSLKVNMAPLDSFKKMTTITDASGKVVAAMYTASDKRPVFGGRGTYNILGATPRTEGQQPMMQSESGIPLYHWGTSKHGGHGNTQTIEVVDGGMYSAKVLIGDLRKMTISKNGDGAGILTSRKSASGDHQVDIAAGFDPLLALCMMYTWYLVMNEKDISA